MIISSWFIAGIPVFVFVYFIIAFLFTVCSFFISNIWDSFASNPVFITTLTHFPITNYIMQNLGYFILVPALIGIAVMFAKPSFQGQGGL